MNIYRGNEARQNPIGKVCSLRKKITFNSLGYQHHPQKWAVPRAGSWTLPAASSSNRTEALLGPSTKCKLSRAALTTVKL